MSRVRFRVFYNSIPYDISFREEETISQLRLFILCVTGKLATEPLASLAAKTERLKQTFLDNDAKNGRKYIINLSDMKDLSYSWVGPWDEHKIEEIRVDINGVVNQFKVNDVAALAIRSSSSTNYRVSGVLRTVDSVDTVQGIIFFQFKSLAQTI